MSDHVPSPAEISLASASVTVTGPREDAASRIGEIPQWRLMARRFRRSKLAVVSLCILILFYLVALFAPFLTPTKPDSIDQNFKNAAPSSWTWDGGPAICRLSQEVDPIAIETTYEKDCNNPIKLDFFGKGYEYKLFGLITTDRHLFTVPEQRMLPFGGDVNGRDVFSRTLQGSRVSLTIGLLGVGIATILGSIIGTISGYFGGRTDNLIQRFIEIIMSIPTLPLWATMAAVLPTDMSVTRRYFLITLVLSLVAWAGLARQVRGKVMAYSSADYIHAARSAGSSHARIIGAHLLPNATSHIVVTATLAVPATILAETALSFLGIGMLDPAISWGVLLKDASKADALQLYPWLLLPAVFVVVAITCFQLIGDGLRDAVDPYS